MATKSQATRIKAIEKVFTNTEDTELIGTQATVIIEVNHQDKAQAKAHVETLNQADDSLLVEILSTTRNKPEGWKTIYQIHLLDAPLVLVEPEPEVEPKPVLVTDLDELDELDEIEADEDEYPEGDLADYLYDDRVNDND